MKKLFGLLGIFRPRNIHDLNRLIESGYAAWVKVYAFLGDASDAVQEKAEAAAEAIVDALDGPDGPPTQPPPLVVTA